MPGETQRMAMPRIESTSRRDQVDEDLEETRIDAASSTFISMALQNHLKPPAHSFKVVGTPGLNPALRAP